MAGVFLIQVLAVVLVISGGMQIIHRFRARSMRAFAAKWGFRYIGPPAPKWWNPSHFDLPHSMSIFVGIRQVWNVVEGERNGVSIFICDGVIGSRGGQPCTFIACQGGQNPFGTVDATVRVVQHHGWTVLYGVWLLWFSWTMSMKRIDHHVDGLRMAQPTS